jgi:outer membrane protein OmpA-like peptidoglycan-associated protein
MEERGDKSGREILVLVGILVLVAAGTMTTYWMRSSGVEAAGKTVPAATVSEVTKPATAPKPGEVTKPTKSTESTPRATAPAPLPMEVIHTDVYFDVKSARLRADAVRTLQEKAAAMDRSGVWAVLVQGYADSQGSPEYNRVLALKRAEAVKQFLIELGVPETAVKVATVGADGILCDEATPECRQLNRRVHLEVRKLREAATPAVQPQSAIPAVQPVGATQETPATVQSR